MNTPLDRRYGKKKLRLEVDHLENVVAAADRQTPEARQQLTVEIAAFWRLLRRVCHPRAVTGGTQVDGRRTMREFLRHGPALTEVRYRRRIRPRRLVTLVDCSESAFRPGLSVLVQATLSVAPEIMALGFDSDVFPFCRGTVEATWSLLCLRCRRALDRGVPLLGLADLASILRLAGRFAANTAQTYLLVFSDLFLHGESDREPALEPIRHALRAYRKVWIVDTWGVPPPFVEAPDGTVTCTMQGLRELLRDGGADERTLAWREAEGPRTWQLPASVLARGAAFCEQFVLEARRFTPFLAPLGFVPAAEATASSRMVYVPDATSHALAMIFREVSL